MAPKGGLNRGIVEKPAGSTEWWMRVYIDGRERRYRCSSKSQAKALYARLMADKREKVFFPEQFKK